MSVHEAEQKLQEYCKNNSFNFRQVQIVLKNEANPHNQKLPTDAIVDYVELIEDTISE